MSNPNSPSLNVNAVPDPVMRRNFTNLQAYFQANGQIDGFQFIDQVFTKAVANQKIPHTLGIVPTDVIITQITGAGTVTFNFGLFDKNNLNLTATDACHVRFFFGVQGGSTSTTNPSLTAAQATSASQSTSSGNETSSVSSGGGSSGAVPTGMIADFGGTTAPNGWLPCNGATISRTQYAALFAYIGVLYGVGDGATTFQVPNIQGLFRRGSGSQVISGITYSGTQGALQGDQFQEHAHVVSDPGHHHSIDRANVSGAANFAAGSNGFLNAGNSGTSSTGLTVGAPSADTGGTPRTGGETRPANIAVLVCIKT